MSTNHIIHIPQVLSAGIKELGRSIVNQDWEDVKLHLTAIDSIARIALTWLPPDSLAETDEQ